MSDAPPVGASQDTTNFEASLAALHIASPAASVCESLDSIDLCSITCTVASQGANDAESFAVINMSKDTDRPKGILGAPIEVLLNIGKFMSQGDKYHLAQTCRDLGTVMTAALMEEDATNDHHALWWACASNCEPLLTRILSEEPSLINYRFQEHHSLNPRVNLNRINNGISKDLTPLIITIAFNATDVFKSLLESGVDVNLPDSRPNFEEGQFQRHHRQWLPINWATNCIRHGTNFEAIIRLLRDHGADINHSPFMFPWDTTQGEPSRGDEMPLFEQLNLYIKALTVLRPTQDQFLHNLELVLDDRRGKLTTLLELGADPNAIEPYTSHRPIYRIANRLMTYEPFVEYMNTTVYTDVIVPHVISVLRILIEHGANPKIPGWDQEGVRSPLHLMCTKIERFEEVANMLIESGVDINNMDSFGRTPLFELMVYPPRDIEFLYRFIQKGADINHRDYRLRTPLHVACIDYKGSHARLQETVKALLRSGAKTTIKDVDGKTPLDLVKSRKHPTWPETAQMLIHAERRDMGLKSLERVMTKNRRLVG
ncbi:ankyrin [Jackrogersella minutella]|nr:ankyrin [Jackrogersella minutella]